MFKTKNFWYISLFVILYLITAGSSFFHAISFFGLANNSWMSIILAFAFEVGQAAVLFSLLTSRKDRSRIMPWVLMTMFTLVQVVGNVFSSYKHIILNSVEDLKYFKEPIFIWTNLPDQEATVIVTWAIGAILPIAALLLTSMITNYLSDQEELKNNNSGISDETKEKLKNLLQEALDNTSEKDWNEFLDDKSKEENNDEKEIQEKELESQVEEEKVEKIEGTDSDGEVIGEQGDDGLKVLQESLNSKDNEIEKLKEDHDKVLDEKFEVQEKFDNLLNDYDEQNKELSKLKKELEELKKPQEQPKELTNSEKKEITQEIHELNKENTKNENLEQVEDLIKNGINDTKKDSHFINI